MSLGSQSLYDRHITIFSPEGKLYQVEYAFRAVKGCNLTAIAVRGVDCACIVAQRKVPLQQAQQDKLLDPSSITCLYNITDEIGAAMVGMPGDCRSMVFRARDIASKFQYKMAYRIPVDVLAHKVANLNQDTSKFKYGITTGGILVGIDEESQQPSVYRFDPAGWFAGHKACATGTKEAEASNALEKLIKTKSLTTEGETVEATIACLQSVLAVEFKPSELEVGIVTKDKPAFRTLSESEIETYLNLIAERD